MKMFKTLSLFLAFFALAISVKAYPTVTGISVNSTPTAVTFSADAYDDYGALYSIDFYVMGPGESDWTFVGNSQTDTYSYYGYSGRAEFSWTPTQFGNWSVLAVPHDLWDAYWDGAASNTFIVDQPLPATGDSITTSANPVFSSSYEVYANNVRNATRVVFPTWTDANGQDELIWYEGVYDGANNRWKRRVLVGEHNHESGSYTTHVYALGTDNQWYILGGVTTEVAISFPPLVPLHRLYGQGHNDDHFYTTDQTDISIALSQGYSYEGICGYVATAQSDEFNTVPLYRYLKVGSGTHFYTTNWSELGGGSNGYAYEGIQCYVATTQVPGTSPFFRFVDPDGKHLYTKSPLLELLHRETSDWETQGAGNSHGESTVVEYRWYGENGENEEYITTTGGGNGGGGGGGANIFSISYYPHRDKSFAIEGIQCYIW